MSVSHEVAVRMSAGAEVIWSPMEAGKSKGVPSPAWASMLVVGRHSQVLPMGTYHGLLECPSSWELTSPEQALQERAQYLLWLILWRILSFLQYPIGWLYAPALFIIGGSCTGTLISGRNLGGCLPQMVCGVASSHPRFIKTVSLYFLIVLMEGLSDLRKHAFVLAADRILTVFCFLIA